MTDHELGNDDHDDIDDDIAIIDDHTVSSSLSSTSNKRKLHDNMMGNHKRARSDSSASRHMNGVSRLSVRTIPYSKNKQFGVDDIHELCDMLTHHHGVMQRLPKITAMFASRACRSAVMIGDALDLQQMTRVSSLSSLSAVIHSAYSIIDDMNDC